MVETCAIEPLNAFLNQQVAIGDEAADDPMGADAADHVIQFRVQQRLATADHNHCSAQLGQLINTAEQLFQWHRIGNVIVFAAISAGKIAAAHGNELRLNGMVRGDQPFGDHAHFAEFAVYGLCLPP